MSNLNSKIALQAAEQLSPITFTATTGAADEVAALTTVRANIDLFLTLIATEGNDEAQQRLFLDQMTPAARTSIYTILLALKANSHP